MKKPGISQCLPDKNVMTAMLTVTVLTPPCGAKVLEQRATAGDTQLDRLLGQKAISILLRNLIRCAQGNWYWVLQFVEVDLDAVDREYVYGWLKGHFLNPGILYAVRQHVNAYILGRLLAKLRREAGASPVEALFGRAGDSAAPRAIRSMPSPATFTRPDIPRRKRRRKRRI